MRVKSRSLLVAARWLNIGLVFLTLPVLAGSLLDPGIYWLFLLAGVSFPLLILFHVLFILFWLSRRHGYFLLSLGILVVGWPDVRTVFGLGLLSGGSPGDAPFRVMTLNAHSLVKVGPEEGERVSEEEWLVFLQATAPDILVLQEYPTRLFADLIRKDYGLGNYLQHGSLAVFSRFPFVDQAAALHRFESGSNGFFWADLKLPSGVIRLYNVHLNSNQISTLTKDVTERVQEEGKPSWGEIGQIIRRYIASARVRVAQARELKQELTVSPFPVLVAGDLNEIPQSPTYRIIKHGLSDAFQAGGRGMGFSYYYKTPGLRIDYLFCDPHIAVRKCFTGPGIFSDHRPVIGEFELKAGPKG